MNQIAAHAQTCATLRIKIKSLKDEAALAEQVNSNSRKLCECMKSFESSLTRVALTSIPSMLNDLSFEENNPGHQTFLTLDGKFGKEEGCVTALAKVGEIHSSMTTHQLLEHTPHG